MGISRFRQHNEAGRLTGSCAVLPDRAVYEKDRREEIVRESRKTVGFILLLRGGAVMHGEYGTSSQIVKSLVNGLAVPNDEANREATDLQQISS